MFFEENMMDDWNSYHKFRFNYKNFREKIEILSEMFEHF